MNSKITYISVKYVRYETCYISIKSIFTLTPKKKKFLEKQYTFKFIYYYIIICAYIYIYNMNSIFIQNS